MNDDREFRTFQFKELRRYQFPISINDLVAEGILKHNCIWEIIGQAKAYKSFVLNTIAVDLITMRNLFAATRMVGGQSYSKAFEVKKACRVLYIEQEIGAQDLKERLVPLYQSLSQSEADLMDENLFTKSFDHSLQLDTENGRQRLSALVAQHKPNVLILDPLVEFHTSNENDTQAMAKVARTFDYLREHFHPLAIIFSHHEGHPTAVSRNGINKGRGSSAIPAKIDTALNVTVHNRDAHTLKLDFTLRRGKPIDSFYVKLEAETMRGTFLCWKKDSKRNGKLPKADVNEFTGVLM